ncbi:RpoD DNA-directed RNA polymerase, sigma subunit (sigma70/sigma32) [Candidatus Nanopelagicaceae bacterium]
MNTRLSLDEIGDALKRLSSRDEVASQSLEDFHSKIANFFPQIQYESNESLWDEEGEEEETYRPPWWDDLDEPFELEELHWLTKIQKYELLKPDEVRRTMESIEAGVFAEAALAGELHNFDINKYGRDKVERVVELGNEAFDYMLIHNLKLAHHLARKYSRKIALEDAFSYAIFGLMQGIRKFDWRLGHQFSTYATWWIRQSLSREIADNETTIGIPVHAVDRVNAYRRDMRILHEEEFTTAGEITIRDKSGRLIKVNPPLPQATIEVDMDNTLTCGLEASGEHLEFWDVFHQASWLLAKYEIPDNSVSSLEYSAMSKDLLERLTAYVLSEREIETIKYRYGFGSSEPMTLEDIGKIYGVTRERIRQIESKSLEKITGFLAEVQLENYWDVIEKVTVDYVEELENAPAAILAQKKRREAELRAEKYWLRKQEFPDELVAKPPRDMTNFVTANQRRTMKASKVQITQVKWALEVLQDEDIPTRSLLVAQARVNNPELSLGELALLFDDTEITKDVVNGVIRRLIARASRVSGEKAPEA